MMCEVPSNALLADEFLDIFDGFSIGSNDLTQLTPGPRPRLLDRRAPVRRAEPGREEAAAMAIKAARPRASTSASAARARPTTRIWPNG
jgi:phosphoenolpyruvate synthase/pyruvate phosphate dikinase